MMIKKVSTEKAPATIGPYVQGNIVNGLLFTSGQIPLSSATSEIVGTSIEVQTKQVMENLAGILHASNSEFDNVVKATCFLSDMENFAIFNEVYASYFNENLPARSCVEVARLPKDVLIEIEIIAVINN